jgi:hypothetical protein
LVLLVTLDLLSAALLLPRSLLGKVWRMQLAFIDNHAEAHMHIFNMFLFWLQNAWSAWSALHPVPAVSALLFTQAVSQQMTPPPSPATLRAAEHKLHGLSFKISQSFPPWLKC